MVSTKIPSLIRKNMLKLFVYRLLTVANFPIMDILAPLSILKITGNESLVGLYVVFFNIGHLVSFLPTGILMDKYKRCPILIIGAIGQIISLLLLSLTLSLGSLGGFMIALIIFGMAGAIAVSSNIAGADMYPSGHKAESIGILGVAASIGLIIGPVMAGTLLDLVRGFSHTPLVITWLFPIGIVAIALISMMLISPDPKDIAENQRDFFPDLKEELLIDQKKSADSMISQLRNIRRFLKFYPLKVSLIASICFTIVSTSIITILAVVLIKKGYSSTIAGVMLTGMGIGMFLSSYPSGLLGDKFGRKRMLVFSLCLALITIPPIFISSSLPLIFVFLALLGATYSLSLNMSQSIIIDITNPSERATISATLGTISSFTRIAFAPLASYVMGNFGWSYVGYIGEVSLILAFPFVFKLREIKVGIYNHKGIQLRRGNET